MTKRNAHARLASDVLKLVADVPPGRVTTYGAIAQALGVGPRQVAAILANDPAAGEVPWHRVVAAGGRLSIPHPDHRAEQARRLRADGLTVADDRVAGFAGAFYAP